MSYAYYPTLRAGTQTATTAAAALNSGASLACDQLLVQADPDNLVSLFVGNASSQPYELKAGDSVTIPVADVATVYVKTASSTAVANWLGVNRQ